MNWLRTLLGLGDILFSFKGLDSFYKNRVLDQQQPQPSGTAGVVYSPRRATNLAAYPSGGAGMVSTIDDYFRFLETLTKGGARILKPETARLIAEDAVGDIPVTQAGEGWGWSLGLSILKDPVAAKTPHWSKLFMASKKSDIDEVGRAELEEKTITDHTKGERQ